MVVIAFSYSPNHNLVKYYRFSLILTNWNEHSWLERLRD